MRTTRSCESMKPFLFSRTDGAEPTIATDFPLNLLPASSSVTKRIHFFFNTVVVPVVHDETGRGLAQNLPWRDGADIRLTGLQPLRRPYHHEFFIEGFRQRNNEPTLAEKRIHTRG